ncbi:GDP-mannose 4,6-dehydratase [Nocardioides fonticola]|uniref:GDP-mannose 4,6-dehydratase n=1 Tax=Nocardioides fonticola TaxID=450363 RepID=A0ABP7XAN8_9ACTN
MSTPRPPLTHLVTGVAGQDGVHLARLLHAAGHRVVGTVSDASEPETLVYLEGIELAAHDVRDSRGFARLLERVRPDVVHNLAALSSVGASWEAEELTLAVNRDAVVAMLAVLREHAERHGSAPRFLQASSSEIFGPATPGAVLDEDSPLAPVSPYGRAKAAAHEAVVAARASGLDAANLVLFGHTGPLHAAHFALPTTCRQAVEVAAGRRERLELRDPSVERDWGGAADFMAAWAQVALSPDPAQDVVVATGQLHRLGEVATWALAAAGAPADPRLIGDLAGPEQVPARPHDVTGVRGDASRLAARYAWTPSRQLRAVIETMVAVEEQRLRTGVRHRVGYLDTLA